MSRISSEQLTELLRTHGPALALYARQWCRSPEDVVQEAFVQLVRLEQSPDDIAAWLFRVVRNQALNASRAASRRARHEAESAQQRTAWFHDDMAERLDAQSVATRLEQLDPDEREVIVARIWGGLSFETIATLVGASASTAFRRYRSGLQTLRAKLETSCPNTMNPSG